jgi:TorA maturation chaperone TorD
MDVNDMLVREMARGEIYKGLSACFYLPDSGLVPQLKQMEVNLAFLGSEALAAAVLMRSGLQRTENLESLQVEFARLFVGPYRLLAPPYGSVYLDGEWKIMGDSTLDVRKCYRESGLGIAETFKDAPDHIAAELEFMYFLVFSEIDAFQSAQENDVCEYLNRQKSFLEGHLGAWAGRFCAKVEKAAECDFYRYLSAATRNFIDEDLQHLTNLNLCPAG